MKDTNITANDIPLHERAQEGFKGTFSDILGLKILYYEYGHCKAYLPIKKDFLNPLGTLHGGFMFIIGDTASGIAATHMGSGHSVTTVSGNISFLRPALQVNELHVDAQISQDGEQIVFVDCKITDENDILYAKGAFTFARITLPEEHTKL